MVQGIMQMLQTQVRILCSTPSSECPDGDEALLHDKSGCLDASPLLSEESRSLANAINHCIQTAHRNFFSRSLLSIESSPSINFRTILVVTIPKATTNGVTLEDAAKQLAGYLESTSPSQAATNPFCASIRRSDIESSPHEELDASLIMVFPILPSNSCALPLTAEENLWLDFVPKPSQVARFLAVLYAATIESWRVWLLRFASVLVSLLVGALIARYAFAVKHDKATTMDILLTNESLARWEHTHDWSDWYLRVDSGEIARKDRAFEKEWMIQEWFKTRPPSNESIDVWRTDDYLRPERWPTALNPAQLHFSHCVARVWRYVMARETGRPACSADLNFEHVSHCLNEIIDQYAFPTEANEMKEVQAPATLLKWHTRFCLD